MGFRFGPCLFCGDLRVDVCQFIKKIGLPEAANYRFFFTGSADRGALDFVQAEQGGFESRHGRDAAFLSLLLAIYVQQQYYTAGGDSVNLSVNTFVYFMIT